MRFYEFGDVSSGKGSSQQPTAPTSWLCTRWPSYSNVAWGRRLKGVVFEQGLEAKGLVVRRNCDCLKPSGVVCTEMLFARRFAPPDLPEGYKYEVLPTPLFASSTKHCLLHS